jgi:hypothetical protein
VSPPEPEIAGVPVVLVVEGDVSAALLIDGAQVRLPATVPAGAWPLWASFNRGDWRSTDVVVEVDPRWPPTVRCGGGMEHCVIE